MSLYERLSILAKKQKISIPQLSVKLGFSEQYLYKWKTNTPKADNLAKVADYFNVSTDYLLGRTDDPDPKSSGVELDWDDTLFLDEETEKNSTPEYFAIQRKSKKLSQKEQQRLLKIMEATFDDLDNGDFEEDEDDDL